MQTSGNAIIEARILNSYT